MELLNMLDAVVTYKGGKEVYKGNLVMFYEALLVLVNLAYKMSNREKGSGLAYTCVCPLSKTNVKASARSSL